MVNALVLLNVDRDKVNDVAEKLSEIEGVSEVYSVAGRYDLAVVIRAKDNDHLADLVTGTLLRTNGSRNPRPCSRFGFIQNMIWTGCFRFNLIRNSACGCTFKPLEIKLPIHYSDY